MYEKSDKETRKEFKETEYGQKTCSWLSKSIIVFLVVAIIFLVLACLHLKCVITIKEDLIIIGKGILAILVVIMVYFDGKRDGAIEMFKKNKKK